MGGPDTIGSYRSNNMDSILNQESTNSVGSEPIVYNNAYETDHLFALY